MEFIRLNTATKVQPFYFTRLYFCLYLKTMGKRLFMCLKNICKEVEVCDAKRKLSVNPTK